MDSRYKKSLYDDKLASILTSVASNAEKYRQLISELKRNRSQFITSIGVLLQNKDRVPLLTEDGGYHVHTSEPITIQIGNTDIRFTQTHLAEIQAILKTGKN